ncbi:N-acetylmuramoyl-L-alanine amidase [Thermoactinospora rubra]|uniref:N-acetylmuramoyl-L-alanine amidase n=1 Tax=Thermoactinospora rubra TaxID=1088767 RepID=UPI000A100DC3|nr:N-acetylmuramoyl-L-alanine amidase [Thermoactinospora rubra]
MPYWIVTLLAALMAPLGLAAPGEQPGRQGDFRRAAAEYGVPESVLLAVSYLQSRWDANAGLPSAAGGYGPMHLVDAAAVRAEEDRRGDEGRPLRAVPHVPDTLREAARLTGLPPERLRADPAANIRGGAALLAAYRAGGSWHEAAARYGGSEAFADEVIEIMRTGAQRVTDDGHPVRLAAHPGLAAPQRPPARAARQAECPQTLSCQWLPAAHARFGRGDYGNHDRVRGRRWIDYIVLHDMEGTWGGVPAMVRDPRYVSWHYTIRSRDGHVAQHVRTRDIAWHAGNWYVNTRSIGIEQEGYLAKGAAWYTEAMYRSAARLVRYLADRYDIPLDRDHILGHDNVPGPTARELSGMHNDPGPFWDWARLFALMEAPLPGPGEEGALAADEGGSVLVNPDFQGNAQPYTGCARKTPCRPQGSSAVWLRTAPRPDAPLVDDPGRRGPSTASVYDHGARASAGQRYAVAGREAEWTAIWYLGRKAWFHNPPEAPAAVPASGPLVTPVRDNVPVYGRAYPERAAYRGRAPYQPLSALPYRLDRGQAYALGLTVRGSFYAARSPDPARHVHVRGRTEYHQIQLGHRMAFVRAADVDVIP